MSVWPETLPDNPSLFTREGALISISICVDPRRLELLLDTLARLDFPVNPEIYHDAAILYVYAYGREEWDAATLVDFPAYEARLSEVRRTLKDAGFDPSDVQVTDMLSGIHAEYLSETAPRGARYVWRRRVRHRGLVPKG